MEQIIGVFAAYLAATLVNAGVVPPPRNDEEKNALIEHCMFSFIAYLEKSGLATVQRVEINAHGSADRN